MNRPCRAALGVVLCLALTVPAGAGGPTGDPTVTLAFVGDINLDGKLTSIVVGDSGAITVKGRFTTAGSKGPFTATGRCGQVATENPLAQAGTRRSSCGARRRSCPLRAVVRGAEHHLLPERGLDDAAGNHQCVERECGE